MNPLEDPIYHIKRPLRPLKGDRRGQGVVRPGQPVLEFRPVDIMEIRLKFWATQRQFASSTGTREILKRNLSNGWTAEAGNSPHDSGQRVKLARSDPAALEARTRESATERLDALRGRPVSE